MRSGLWGWAAEELVDLLDDQYRLGCTRPRPRTARRSASLGPMPPRCTTDPRSDGQRVREPRRVRFWLQRPGDVQPVVACGCSWSPESGTHYRVSRVETSHA